MDAIFDIISANPIRTAVLALVVLVLTVMLFGRDRIWGAIVRVYNDLRGGSACLSAIVLTGMLAGCVDPVADARQSIEDGDNAAAAAAVGGVQSYRNVITSCLFLDAPEIRMGIDAVARSAGMDAALADIREDRREICEEMGGWTFTREAAED